MNLGLSSKSHLTFGWNYPPTHLFPLIDSMAPRPTLGQIFLPERHYKLAAAAAPPNSTGTLRCRGPPQPGPFQVRGEVNRIAALSGFPGAEPAETSHSARGWETWMRSWPRFAGGHGPKRSSPSGRSMMPHDGLFFAYTDGLFLHILFEGFPSAGLVEADGTSIRSVKRDNCQVYRQWFGMNWEMSPVT